MPTPHRENHHMSQQIHQPKTSINYTEEQVNVVREIRKNKDYYAILGVEKSSSAEEIKRAYKKLSLKIHPDKNKAPGAEEAFKSVSNALNCLSNEQLRRNYDQIEQWRRRNDYPTEQWRRNDYQTEQSRRNYYQTEQSRRRNDYQTEQWWRRRNYDQTAQSRRNYYQTEQSRKNYDQTEQSRRNYNQTARRNYDQTEQSRRNDDQTEKSRRNDDQPGSGNYSYTLQNMKWVVVVSLVVVVMSWVGWRRESQHLEADFSEKPIRDINFS